MIYSTLLRMCEFDKVQQTITILQINYYVYLVFYLLLALAALQASLRLYGMYK